MIVHFGQSWGLGVHQKDAPINHWDWVSYWTGWFGDYRRYNIPYKRGHLLRLIRGRTGFSR